MTPKLPPPPIPNHLAARIGVLAKVDTKTVVRACRGENVRASSLERIKLALAQLEDGKYVAVLK